MGHFMMRPSRLLVASGLLIASANVAAAQTASAAQDVSSASTAGSSFWFAGGGSFSTIRGDCQTCEEDYPYRHSGSVVADVGRRVNQRMDVAVEVFWAPMNTSYGRVNSTHLDAVAQFRPWSSKGFFVKGGAGMAFIKNWVELTGPDATTQKALSLVIGAGWAFRPQSRVGLQVFGTQHAAALGDLQTGEESISDVIGNYWSLGAAITIR
jgi:hypothetical protein